MNLSINIFIKSFTAVLVVGVLSPAICASTRDETLDYECRPRWDRFIVDENATNWDKDSMMCYDKYGNRIDPSKLYGAPKVYGEYEPDAQIATDARKLYGTPEQVSAASLYGKYEPLPSTAMPKMAGKKPVIKPDSPIRKPAVSSNFSKNNTIIPAKVNKKPEIKPIPAPPVAVQPDAQKPLPPAIADKKARVIANSLNDTVDIDTYCRQINPPVLGDMPRGVILMPGRTDLMSCVRK